MSETDPPPAVTEQATQAQASTNKTPGAPQGQPTQEFKATSATHVSNIAELREKAPEFYQQLLENLAQRIVRDVNRHHNRLKEAIRRGRNG
jgi:molybdopterin converting factor small subunit